MSPGLLYWPDEHSESPPWLLRSALRWWTWRGAFFPCPIYPTASSLASQHLLLNTPQQCLICDPCAPTKVFNDFLCFVVKSSLGICYFFPQTFWLWNVQLFWDTYHMSPFDSYVLMGRTLSMHIPVGMLTTHWIVFFKNIYLVYRCLCLHICAHVVFFFAILFPFYLLHCCVFFCNFVSFYLFI